MYNYFISYNSLWSFLFPENILFNIYSVFISIDTIFNYNKSVLLKLNTENILLDLSGLMGLEPATSALTGRCSCLLNYNPREIRKDLAEILDSFLFYRIRYFLRTRVFYHLIVDWQIVGPSWIWTSVDILSTNLQSVPINHSGIDPTPNSF